MSTSHTAGHGPGSAAAPDLSTVQLRRFRVECECDGAPFVWHGTARSEQQAIRLAAYDLAVRCPEVEAEHVRATSCIEVTA